MRCRFLKVLLLLPALEQPCVLSWCLGIQVEYLVHLCLLVRPFRRGSSQPYHPSGDYLHYWIKVLPGGAVRMEPVYVVTVVLLLEHVYGCTRQLCYLSVCVVARLYIIECSSMYLGSDDTCLLLRLSF